LDADVFFFKQKTILYIEDEKTTREQTTAVLNLMFKDVLVAKSAEEGLDIFDGEKVDLILADIGLPQKDGLSLVKTIRAENYRVPIVMLTSTSAQEQLLQAVNLGIDGYIIKPFELGNLIKVLSKALQRSDSGKQQIIDFGGGILFSVSTQEISIDGKIIPLGKKERELLEILVTAHPNTVSFEDIYSRLWPMESVGDSALKNLVMRMRKKIGDDLILCVKSAGYRVRLTPAERKSQGNLF
jgi:DNA-binding response OmpR family regulator